MRSIELFRSAQFTPVGNNDSAVYLTSSVARCSSVARERA